MFCGLGNPNGDLICLAHSNRLQDGRGFAHKSIDELGAFLCDRCHKDYDLGKWPVSERDGMFTDAWERSIRWAITKKGRRLVRVE